MNVVFLSVGGNLGNRLENIAAAKAALGKTCGRILSASGIYETEPWGSSSGNKYLNCVMRLETGLSARQLLKKTMSIERRLGRKRGRTQYSDRTMDIDILFFNREVIDEEALQIPHPRLHLRNFVLVPLHEIEKKLVHPVLNKSIATLLKSCKDKLAAVSYTPPAGPRYICIEGNIGSGKSSLAKALAKKLKARLVSEKFEANPLLPLFYKDPGTYAFALELSFLLERFRQLKEEVLLSRQVVVSDFSFYKSLWFAGANLPAKELKLFKKQFNALAAMLPEPDLVICLDTDLKNLKQNIQKRGRPYELGIKGGYLKLVGKKYRIGIQTLNIKKLTLRIGSYHPELERQSIKTIENYIKENFGGKSQKAYI